MRGPGAAFCLTWDAHKSWRDPPPPTPNPPIPYTALPHTLPAVGRLEQQLPPQALRDFADAAIQRCHRMPTLELSPTLLGLSYMGCLPRDVAHVAEAFLDEACSRLREFSPQVLECWRMWEWLGRGWGIALCL